MVTATQVFTSVTVDPSLRTTLIARLAAAHAVRPFDPGDPRNTIGRASEHVQALGLRSAPIRGTVSIAGVEVDHVWLAVSDRTDTRWVLDASLPLREPGFVTDLAGYVAGTVSGAELARAAAALGIEQRILGVIPAEATYRGLPYWAARHN